MYKKYLVIFYVVLVALLLGLSIKNNRDSTEAHESVHRQIDLYFGCKNVTMNVTWFNGGSVKCEDENQTFYPEQETMHRIGQVNLGVFFLITMIFIVAYLFLLKWEDDTRRPDPPSPPPRTQEAKN